MGRMVRPMNRGRQFGTFVRRVRLSAGMTQAEFAEEVGVSCPDLVRRWENGYNWPVRETVERIAKIANQVSGSATSSLEGAFRNGQGRGLPERKSK